MNTALTFHRIRDTDKQIVAYEDLSLEKFNLILNKINGSCQSLDHIKNSKSKDISWLLTFDDGFSSDFEIVLPLLKEYKINAIFFIATAFVGKPNYLTWDQIRCLVKNGMDIGSHSVNHQDMLSLSKFERINEFSISRKIIENKISIIIKAFSFPFGRYNTTLINEAFQSGYEYCFTSKPGVFTEKDKLIPRISLNGNMSNDDIIKIVEKCGENNLKKLFLYEIKDFAKICLGMKNYWRIRNIINMQK